MATKVKKEVEISAKDLASKTLESLSYKFKKFEGAIKSVQNAAGNVARSARGIVTLFGGIATAGVAAINKMANQADDLQTMANVIGMNVEAYQKYRYAAEQNDVTTEGFDKSLRMLSKSMGELRAGTGSLYTKLKRTSPALLQQLRAAKDNESAFRIMMDAINKTTNAQKKAYLATAAFGKSGQELISLANAGLPRIDALGKKLEKFGLVTEDGAKAADVWGNSMADVRLALQGVGYTILNKVLPVLNQTVDSLADWIAENRELIAERVVEWGKKFYNVLKSIAAVMKPLVELFSKYSWLVYVVFGAKAAGLVVNIIKLAFSLGNLIAAVWSLNAALWACPVTWIVAAAAAIAALVYWWEDINAWFDRMIEKYPKLKLAFEFMRNYLKTIKAPIDAIIWAIKKLIQGIEWLDNWWNKKHELTVEQKASANNWLAEQGLIEQPKYSPVSSSGLQMSPLASNQAQIMTMGGMSQSADINVRFDNLPPMTRIETVTNDTDLDLEIYRGTNGGTIQ